MVRIVEGEGGSVYGKCVPFKAVLMDLVERFIQQKHRIMSTDHEPFF